MICELLKVRLCHNNMASCAEGIGNGPPGSATDNVGSMTPLPSCGERAVEAVTSTIPQTRPPAGMGTNA
jgi:hypothetical protein